MSRRLLVTTRSVSHDADYDAHWSDLVEAVTAAGGRAWRFHSPTDRARRIEFLEWKDDVGDLPEMPAVKAACARLDRCGPALSREPWEEE